MSGNKPRQEDDVVLSTLRHVVQSAQSDVDSDVREQEPATEKLLLTPSLRVDHDLPPPATTPRRNRVQTRTLTAERISLEQRIAELEQAVGNGGGWEPDGSELVDEETPTSFVFAQHPNPDSTELVDENDLNLPPAGAWATPGPIEPRRRSEPQETPLPDLTADPKASDVAPKLTQLQSAEIPASPFTRHPAPVDSRTIQQPSEVPQAADPEPSLSLEEERVIDEEALRDLVAEIVRSELQGELGERITRNVRKLVRREIHRAIMARDFG